MNSMVATETTDTAAAAKPPLENHAANEKMRHLPTLEWIIAKLEADVRQRVEILLVVHQMLHHDDARRADLEGPLRSLCRAIERLGDVIRHARANHAPSEVGAHIVWSIEHTAATLRTHDADLFGRRFPFHTGERSKTEALYGALLVVLAALDRAIIVGRAIEPGIDEKLYAHLVKLDPPMRSDAMA
jgi:hypothetical protein